MKKLVFAILAVAVAALSWMACIYINEEREAARLAIRIPMEAQLYHVMIPFAPSEKQSLFRKILRNYQKKHPEWTPLETEQERERNRRLTPRELSLKLPTGKILTTTTGPQMFAHENNRSFVITGNGEMLLGNMRNDKYITITKHANNEFKVIYSGTMKSFTECDLEFVGN